MQDCLIKQSYELKSIPVVVLVVHVLIKRMLSKFQTSVSWNSRSRGQDVKKFGTRAGIRIFVLRCSHNLETNAVETTGKQEGKLFG